MKLTYTTAALAAAAMLAAPALGQTTIIQNDFVNGNPLSGAGPLESPFFTTSSGDGLASDNGTLGVLDFASGTSGRSIHTLFAPQTLANAGDVLTVSYTFTTPATVGNNEDFRVGLFNTNGAAGFAEDISASSSTPNAILNGLPGVSGEFDINTASADLAIRTNNINEIDDLDGDLPDDLQTGRLLATTDGFTFVESGPDNGFAIAPNTQYTGTFALELDAGGDLIVTQTLVGGTVNESFISGAVPFTDDVAAGDAGVNTLTFDFLGFSATGDAFGSVNDAGVADNGADFNNVTVTFTPVPEPASMALLAGGAMMLAGRRRKG